MPIFNIATSAVSVATRVTIDTGTEGDSGVHAFQISVVVTPPGSPTPPPSLSSLTLSQSSGAFRQHGHRNGQTNLASSRRRRSGHIARQYGRPGDYPTNVTVPAGSISATFTTPPAPKVNPRIGSSSVRVTEHSMDHRRES